MRKRTPQWRNLLSFSPQNSVLNYVLKWRGILPFQGSANDTYKSRVGGYAFREGWAEQARGEGHGGDVLRGDSPGARKRGERQAIRVRQLSAAQQTPASWPQPQDRRGNPHYGAAGGHVPRKPEVEGAGRADPWKARRPRIACRRFRRSATSPLGR